MIFTNKEIDFGEIRTNSTLTGRVGYTDDRELIDVKLSSSCRCTNVKWDRINHCITFNISTGNIPNHLRVIGKYSFNQTITVQPIYRYSEEQLPIIIRIKATVIK